MLPWKFQKTPTKMLVKERRLKLSRARIKARIRRKILLIPLRRPQILLSLSSTKLLTQGSQDESLGYGVLAIFVFFFFFLLLLCLLCCLFFKRSVPPFLLSMKISFFHLIHNNMCYKIHCQSMATFCHFNLNRIYCHIV